MLDGYGFFEQTQLINIIYKMITSLSEDIHAFSRRGPLQEYQIVHHKLHDFIEKVNDKIMGRIQLVKQVYLDDYKQQVSQMAAELKSIRGVLDEQLLKQRSNQRLFYLEEERDFFRAQVIKLNEDLKKSNDENQRMKVELYQTKQQCQNLKKIVYDLQTRIYKLTYENIQIQKLKQDGRNIQTTGLSLNSVSPTPTKGYVSDRNDKFPNVKGESTKKHSGFRENESQNLEQGGLTRQKTQYSLRKLKPSFSLGPSTSNLHQYNGGEASSRQQILDRCIKQLKKQIYYRNLSVKEGNKISFEQEQKINFEKFTKSDKKQLVYRFMSHPQILEQFYKFIFVKNRKKQVIRDPIDLGSLDKIAIAKGIDPKFNTKMLESFKAQFDKRIYDIKVNRY